MPAPTTATSWPWRSAGIEPRPAGCAIQSSNGNGKSGPKIVTGPFSPRGPSRPRSFTIKSALTLAAGTCYARGYAGSRSPFKGAGRPGPGSQKAPGPVRRRLERADFLCLGTLLSPPSGVADPLVVLQAAEAVSLDSRVMDEHVGGSVVGGDEAVALVGVEPLDSAFSHVLLL